MITPIKVCVELLHEEHAVIKSVDGTTPIFHSQKAIEAFNSFMELGEYGEVYPIHVSETEMHLKGFTTFDDMADYWKALPNSFDSWGIKLLAANKWETVSYS